MMKLPNGDRCTNMNHGRLNAPVKYCPMCGDVVNKAMGKRCDQDSHASQRKNRMTFCCECGVKLASR